MPEIQILLPDIASQTDGWCEKNTKVKKLGST
jgi:hypothetical protein